jgi:hypothetical protein
MKQQVLFHHPLQNLLVYFQLLRVQILQLVDYLQKTKLPQL